MPRSEIQDGQHESVYVLPHNMQEINRLDFQHYLSRQLLKGNYLAPISQPTSILDVGCGTGRWLLEMGKDFPAARLFGMDLKRPQALPSYLFVEGDLLEGLPFADNQFDFTHQRLLMLAVPAQHWPAVINNLVRVTRPGGWIEVVEGDLFMQRRGPVTQRMTEAFFQLCQKRGIDLQIGQRLKTQFPMNSVVSVEQHDVELKFGNWGGRVGQFALRDQIAALHAIKSRLAPQLGVSETAYEQMVAQVEQECEQYRSFSFLRVFTAQKKV